ncbi:MAG: class I SAM-dependent methyltransferase [Dehalococcoidia bacterium]
MKHSLYVANLSEHSDIREHLGLLRGLALECDVVVELGFRTGVSTSAFLAAERPVVYSYDIAPNHAALDRLQKAYPKLRFVNEDSRKADIPQCDMLFIDTDHTEATTKAELEQHSDKVGRWIVLHDTKTFGRVDRMPGNGKGILAAVDWFLSFYSWKIILHINNNNGLTILEEVNAT